MNARLYDPMLGRFLSADDYVQMPENSQNFNRYAYCVNNPLKYSDPSGNFIEWAVVAMAAWQAGMTSWANGDSFMGGAAQGAAVSIVSQGFAYGIGSAFGHQVGSVWNEALRAGAHGITQGALNAAQGGNFWDGFASGSLSSIAGSAANAAYGDPNITIAVSTVVGGLATLITDESGNSFFQGAMIGFNVGCLNHCGGSEDWYEDEDGNLKCFYSCSPKVKSEGRIWRNKGHVLTKNGKYYSLFGQRYEKGCRNGRFARLLDKGVMNTARYEAIVSVESSSGYYTSEQINPALTDFSNFCIDTGMLPDNAVYYDYGGYKGNACITFKTNTANMLVCATNFSANGIRGIKNSAYNMMFTPLHVDRPVDTVRFWFKGGEGGLQKYNFYQKLVNSYK